MISAEGSRERWTCCSNAAPLLFGGGEVGAAGPAAAATGRLVTSTAVREVNIKGAGARSRRLTGAAVAADLLLMS